MEDRNEWLLRARNGDLAAFEALIGPLVDPGCQLAFTFVRDWQEAEDVVQEACVKAWRAVGRLRDDTPSLRPWFFTIVANESRSRRRTRWWSVIRMAEPMTRRVQANPEERATLKADLDTAMQRLGEAQRKILFLHFYLDLPLDEIGRVLGISTEAVKSRLYGATRSLRPAMAIQEVGP